MKKTFIILLFCSLVGAMGSCKKDSTIQEPTAMAHLLLVNKIPENKPFSLKFDGILVDADFQTNENLRKVTVEGPHSFVVSDPETNKILLDTTLITGKHDANSYLLFRVNPSDNVQLLKSVNTDTVKAPQTGYAKISLANFTRHLPQNIEIVFVQDDMYTGAVDTAAVFTNPGKGFSAYKNVKMFLLPGEMYNTVYRIFLRDSVTKEDLAFMTDPVTGEPIDWSWAITYDLYPLYPQQKVFTVYMYSSADDPSAPTHYSTYINNF